MTLHRANSAWVYPRVCGGTSKTEAETVAIEGLSPRVRGNHRDVASARKRHGSIPACAGEPPKAVHAPLPMRVYPRRVRGTHAI